MLTARDYWFRCGIVRVIDGDTLVVHLGLGLGAAMEALHIRLLDVDTPELRGSSPEEHARAVAAKAYTEAWLAEHAAHDPQHPDRPFWIRTEKADSFGRWLGRLECGEGRVLNLDLIVDGMAAPYKTPRGTW